MVIIASLLGVLVALTIHALFGRLRRRWLSPVAVLGWVVVVVVVGIGALMLHLAATETYYQMNTFDGIKWDSWSKSIKEKWDPAMDLGDAGRAERAKADDRGSPRRRQVDDPHARVGL